MLRGVKRLWLSAVLMLFCVLPALAQATDSAMTGKLVDSTGAVIAGVSVNVVNKDTGLSFTITSDEQGLFHLEHLPVGVYTVTAESSGFKRTSAEVKTALNGVVDLVIKLEPGQIDEVLVVQAGSEALVETTTSSLSNTFNDRKVVELPSFNSSQLELALLAPNVVSQAGGTAGEGGSVGGNRPRNNSFTIDGVDNNDTILTGHVVDVIPETVQEFSILTNHYSAEFGHSSAGQFNTITKSGSNEFHGGVSFFNNNKNYNAVDHLTKEAIARGELPDKRPRVDLNRIAGYFGGPIIKNRLFFFGGYQFRGIGTAGAPASFLTPTAQGFSILRNLRGVSPFSLDLLQRFATPSSVATDSVSVLGANIPVGTINFLNPAFDDSHIFNINVDQVIGNDQLRYRYNYNRVRKPNIGNGTPTFNGQFMALNQLASFTYVHSFSPTLINEFRTSYRRKNNLFGVPDEFSNFPNIAFDDLGFNFGPQGDSPQSEVTNSYQFVNNVSWITGKHNFKTGVEFRVITSANLFLPRGRGEYDYATLEEFLQDVKPTGFNGGLKGVGESAFSANQKAIYGFFQDDFHVTPNLTLNLGLRYEYYTLFRDEKLQALNSIANIPGIIEFRKPKTDTNNFAPRIGLAWSPNLDSSPGRLIFGQGGKGVLRAGFGLSYDVNYGNLATLQLPPQFQQELNVATGDGGPFGSASSFLQNGGLGNIPIPPLTVADARIATQAFIPDKITPYSINYTLEYQREIAKDYAINVRYLGTRGVKLNTQVRLNGGVPPFAIVGGSLPTYLSSSQVPDIRSRDSMLTLDDLQAAVGLGLGALGDQFPPTVTAFLPIGSSNYHSGAVELTKRFSKGYSFSAVYTYSHTIDFGTNDLFTSFVNPRRAQDGFNIGADRGRSALDRPHRFVFSGIYELPFFRNSSNSLTRNLLGGWQFNVIYTAESGQPFTALSATDSNLNLDAAGDRAILNPNGVKGTGSGVTELLNSDGQVVGYVADNGNAQYIQAGPGTISTAGLNTLRSPGINNWDLSIFKNFKLGERFNLQFRAEMFNAFNHEQLIIGNGSVIDPNLLGIANATNLSYANVASPTFNNPRVYAGRPRVINLGLKLTF
jgi:hypothetical protein